MGSSSSKGARAAGASARKFPSRPSNTTQRAPAPPLPQPSRPGPSVHPQPQASHTKTDAVNLDARDPGLASRLNTLGAVQPNPHYSPTSTSSFDPQRNQSTTLPSDMMQAPYQSAFPDPKENPALRVLAARQRIQELADEERNNVGRRGFQGRQYVDASAIQLALMRRSLGESDQRIEEALGIKKGRLSVLGTGIVDSVAI
ncbi:hypothetical protein K504DRAFT_473581 [Pleomassaria siparia CBS 279.74]|uniref:Helix-turn-helix domain-containing protein n=1 Tax=Pleomassaria siparia CBS 279.74 TaxID=1314801 RepID=A0A6G1JU87_9PLEO|nr:hypothetical protein K504DRAFT_473581 [Pleomassaria siparia CBS 279.74]